MELDQLVRKTLSANHDLARAHFRVRELAALLKVQKAERLPRAELDFTGKRARFTPSGALRFGKIIYGEFSGSLRASYEVDLWRRLSASEKAAYFDLLSAKENRKALALSLAAETVSAYLEAAFLSCERDLLREELEVSSRYLSTLEEKYARGLLSSTELLSAKRAHQGLKALLPELERDLRARLQVLELLSGRYPSGTLRLKEAAGLCRQKLPPPPGGIPSDLLLRRPDLRAAQASLRAMAERVKVARRARLPRIVLTAEEGRVSPALKNLLSSKNRLWTLLFGITQPIFEGGRLSAEEKAARMRYQQAQEEYFEAVLEALKEVEYGFLTEKRLQERVKAFEREVRLSQKKARFEKARFETGLLPAETYLKALMEVFESKRKFLAAKKLLFLNRVFLYRALAGDFEEEKE